MSKMITGLVGATLGLVLLAPSEAVQAAGKVRTTSDQDFVARALAQGLFEVKLSERAAKDATDTDVRKFAKQMTTEHDRTNKRLLGLAHDMKLAVAQGFDKDSREAFDRITRLSGAKFDRAYMDEQVKAHENAIKLFESRAKGTPSATVKTFINETLPHLRDHLKQARTICTKLESSR
jgi:putative membrane protein